MSMNRPCVLASSASRDPSIHTVNLVSHPFAHLKQLRKLRSSRWACVTARFYDLTDNTEQRGTWVGVFSLLQCLRAFVADL